ncbi:ERAP1 C domain containing protein [Asbolus verrucosus]|uniref:ERAP1 C domain containing protein n=1 Tax=Asbolus verrucosus TaxID=1661398 RepID=A0A482V932_ASBVE|nr:ERAP1 C domain containing protein [Asbolus verrucosus]
MSHKNLKTVVYCNALRYSENIAEDWDFLWKEFGNTRLATEQATILPALGCTTDKTILTDYLHKSINTTTGIRPQDALSVFSAVYSSNPEGVDIALEFLIEHHNKISDYYGTMNSLSSLITGLGNRFTRQEQIDKLKNFIDTTTDLPESLKTSAQIALDTAAANLKFITKFENELRTYFKVESTTTTTTPVSTTTTTVTTTTDNSNSALSLEVQVTLYLSVHYQ